MRMTRPTHLRRNLAVLAGGSVVAASGWLPVGPAAAGVPTLTEYSASGTSTADSGCTVTSGSDEVENGPKVLHHGHAKGSVNLTTTWTNGSNSSDVTTVSGHYGGTADLALHNGALKSAALHGSGHVTVTRALGGASTCDVGATLSNLLAFETNQPKAGWFYVTRNTSKDSAAETIIENVNTSQPVIFELFQGGAGTVTQRAFTKHGLYVTEVAAGIQGGVRQILAKNGSTVSRASQTNDLSVAFYNAGSAFGRAKGSATNFVRFPGSISCSHHSARLTWKSGASKVANGAFFVNGKKKATVSSPNAGHHVVLRHLGRTADNTVSVRLSLKGGGSASASLAYVPCGD
jgi:hypothetical protein